MTIEENRSSGKHEKSNELFQKVDEQHVVVFEQYNVRTFVSFSLLKHVQHSLNDDAKK